MKILETHIVPENTSKIRLSDYANGIFESIPSRKGIKKAIKAGRITINQKVARTGDWVESGQKIELLALEKKLPKIYELPLEILFEDDYLAIIDKPEGIPVSGNFFKTIQNALLFNLKPSNQIDALELPRPVHRLDGPTSGLLIIAKTRKAQMNLGQQFEKRLVEKQYQAIVHGWVPTEGSFDDPLDDKEALTHFSLERRAVSQELGKISLVNLFPKTGRTHQIRRHLSMAGYPIIGDTLYDSENIPPNKGGLFLCAVSLSLSHPITLQKLEIKIDLPQKYWELFSSSKTTSSQD